MGRNHVILLGDIRPSHVTEHRHITEQRAPTDESVKLLKEMEEKAEQRLLKSIKIKNNEFSGELQVYEHAADMSVRARLVFSLNGHRHVVETAQERHDEREHELVSRLLDEVSKEIARQIITPLLHEFKTFTL